MPVCYKPSRVLARAAKNRLELLENSPNDKPIVPEKWEDFAALCNIRSGKKIIKFVPFEYQCQLNEAHDKYFGQVITKSRQLGITEYFGSKYLHKAALNEGYAAAILSKNQTDTSNVAKRIRRMLDGLSGIIEPENDSLTDLKLKNGGRILFRNASPNGCRGLESISDLLFDECGFVDDIQRIYDSALPSTEMVGDDARVTLLCTPTPKVGFYWEKLSQGNGEKDITDVCEKMRRGEIDPVQSWVDIDGWCKFIIHWRANPIYSKVDNYLEKIRTQKKLSWETIYREYDLWFGDSDESVFGSDLVNNAVRNYDGFRLY